LKNVFSKIQNGGFSEDDVIFEKKSTFFQQGRSHPKLNIFQILKKQFCCTNTQDIPIFFAKMAEICQMDGVWTFSYMKKCLVTVIFIYCSKKLDCILVPIRSVGKPIKTKTRTLADRTKITWISHLLINILYDSPMLGWSKNPKFIFRLKGLSVRIIFSLGLMIIWACGLLPIRPKSQNSNIPHDGTLSIRNFKLMLKKPMDLNLEHPCSMGTMDMIRPKSQNTSML
jgi:hypothetical protein